MSTVKIRWTGEQMTVAAGKSLQLNVNDVHALRFIIHTPVIGSVVLAFNGFPMFADTTGPREYVFGADSFPFTTLREPHILTNSGAVDIVISVGYLGASQPSGNTGPKGPAKGN